jgi:hypothetical protein
VVGVVVRQEDLGKLREADRRPEELPLRPLAAVEEDPLAPAAEKERRRPSSRSWNRPGSAEKHEVEVHAGKCTAAAAAL